VAAPLDLDSLALDPAILNWLKARQAQNLPPIWEVPVDKLRAGLEAAQAQLTDRPRALADDLDIPVGPSGKVHIRLLRPASIPGKRPIVVYLHGGGWVQGSHDTHDRLARDVVQVSGAAMAVVHYSRSPEVRYPVALEECYAVAAWLAENGGALGLDGSRMAVFGDSSGGHLAAAMTVLAKRRGGPDFRQQTLVYPVTDAECSSASYDEFEAGPNLTRRAMQWYWDQYAPDTESRRQGTASLAGLSPEDLRGLPPALVITAQYDVLRDEGEAYADMLRKAGVPVTAARYLGVIHGFASNNAVAGIPATRALVAQVGEALKDALKA